jgi:hypothetical protein
VIHPRSRVIAATMREGHLRIRLDNGEQIDADHVLYATGYKVDLRRVPFLSAGNLLAAIALRDGYPVLDPSLQSTVPGLHFTSLPAARDFGPFFGFTVSVRASAKIIGRAVRPG